MGIAKGKENFLSLNLSFISYPRYFEYPLIAAAYPGYHILDDIPRQTVQRSEPLQIGGPLHEDVSLFY